MLFASVGIVAVLIAGYFHTREELSPTVRVVDGTIARIDAEKRLASVDVIHPRTGPVISIKGEVPADCRIELYGKPATLNELEAGQRVTVEGTIWPTKRVTANWMNAQSVPTVDPADAGADLSASAAPPHPSGDSNPCSSPCRPGVRASQS